MVFGIALTTDAARLKEEIRHSMNLERPRLGMPTNCAQRHTVAGDVSGSSCKVSQIPASIKHYREIIGDKATPGKRVGNFGRTWNFLTPRNMKIADEMKESVFLGWKELLNCVEHSDHVCVVKRFISQEEDPCLYAGTESSCPTCDDLWEKVESKGCWSSNADIHVKNYLSNPSVQNWKALATCMNRANPKYVTVVKQSFPPELGDTCLYRKVSAAS
jgi:hypothetical protein